MSPSAEGLHGHGDEPNLKPSAARILVVDDEEVIRDLVMAHLVRRGHSCEGVSEGRHALALAATGAFDVVLADLRMPGMDGLALTRELQRAAPLVPVVLVTGSTSFDDAIRALRSGAVDYVAKPFQLESLDHAVDRALHRRRAFRDAEQYRRALERKVDEHTHTAALLTGAGEDALRSREAFQRLTEDVETVLIALAAATEPPAESGVVRRVRAWTELLACRAGLPGDDVRDAAWAVVFRALSASELIDGIQSFAGARAVARAIDERWDGTGPRGLAGDRIPVGARVAAVAVAFDRAARDGGHDDAMESLRTQAGYSLDPRMTDLFLSVPAVELASV